ncbi:hypothetical protein GWI33_021117 [Rhynchophorus ferrugineus]|uniref:Uncharacterized protein n=1 Tax=Rhynchophorus ferrugineus TaxID=354439 RepID=A0A834HR21_RHYFE|nr:hypothetical protein GWI33_021117 [Rhynchophorus ferrugineus]
MRQFNEILEELEENNKAIFTELQDRLITLSALLKTLKESVSKEKILWQEELKETIDLEHKLSHNKRHKSYHLSEDALKLEMEKEIAMNLYKQKIMEAESMCNVELFKIKTSIETLIPLQLLINDWNIKNSEVENPNNCKTD